MPVAMTDHVVHYWVLAGLRAFLCGWVMCILGYLQTKRPAALTIVHACRPDCQRWYVKLYDKSGKDLNWTLPGVSEPGVYPIVPVKRTWCLDKG